MSGLEALKHEMHFHKEPSEPRKQMCVRKKYHTAICI